MHELIHLLEGLIETKSDPEPLSSNIGDNIQPLQLGMKRLRPRSFEGQEISAPHLVLRNNEARSVKERAIADAPKKMVLQRFCMRMDDGRRDALIRKPAHDRIEPVQAGRIEGRAHEAPAVRA